MTCENDTLRINIFGAGIIFLLLFINYLNTVERGTKLNEGIAMK